MAVGVAFFVPLVFWPGAELPFSSAKEWLLAAWVVAGFALSAWTGLLRRKSIPSKGLWAAAVWISALALSAGFGDDSSLPELLHALVPCAGFLLLLWISPKPHRLVLALVLSGSVVALVALLQFVGLDPFLLMSLTGSLQGNSRIRIFATLGNPNFVAAFLAAILPLTISYSLPENRRSGKIAAYVPIAGVLLQAGAIFATGSRAPILGLAASGAWLAFRKARSRMRFVGAGLALCGLLLLFSPARPLDKTIAGRFHIWKTVGSHITEIPVAGFGPGAFEIRFAQWETAALSSNPTIPDHPFAGLQDHAHNDYLEILVDHGFLGLLTFLVVLAWLLPLFPPVRMAGLADGMIASVIALLAVALVDFPLHRPAERYLFWTLMALLCISSESTGAAGDCFAEFLKKPHLKRRLL
jgi:putative inorganic carbon (hco3(-)) transporter